MNKTTFTVRPWCFKKPITITLNGKYEIDEKLERLLDREMRRLADHYGEREDLDHVSASKYAFAADLKGAYELLLSGHRRYRGVDVISVKRASATDGNGNNIYRVIRTERVPWSEMLRMDEVAKYGIEGARKLRRIRLLGGEAR